MLHGVPAYPNALIEQGVSSTQKINFSIQLSKWADILLVQADPTCLTQLLKGQATDTLSTVVRSWDASKRIILLPDFPSGAWKNPVTARQLKKLKRDFPWVQLLRPALWDVNGDITMTPRRTYDWEGAQAVRDAVATEAAFTLAEGQPSYSWKHNEPTKGSKAAKTEPKYSLPPEIWTIVFEHIGDWELATALGIYHQIPTPTEWQRLLPDASPSSSQTPSLEYTILTRPLPAIRSYLTSSQHKQHPITLSSLSIKLIFKFSLTNLLTYLSLHQKDIFWTSFAQTIIPHAASAIYNKPAILQWWHTSPAVLQKNYGPEALDGASRAGFVDVLDWWLHSGLPLYYTEKALEYASAKGQIAVLDWWKAASASRRNSHSSSNSSSTSSSPSPAPSSSTKHPPSPTSRSPPLPLKIGKSILFAAQSGRATTIAWWDRSGLPYTHEDGVARLASTHGHVDVLDTWLTLKGSKMIFDETVLVGATRNGHAHVLEWWRGVARGGRDRYQHQHLRNGETGGGGVGGGGGGGAGQGLGLVVEYKTCDIEEAMEDAVGSGMGGGEQRVREWWERNGLNLGVGTGEWMKVKTL
ncbi:MAG: hypothetical protein Q9160_005654 [Pyrenula sp. 1 TL-2023]